MCRQRKADCIPVLNQLEIEILLSPASNDPPLRPLPLNAIGFVVTTLSFLMISTIQHLHRQFSHGKCFLILLYFFLILRRWKTVVFKWASANSFDITATIIEFYCFCIAREDDSGWISCHSDKTVLCRRRSLRIMLFLSSSISNTWVIFRQTRWEIS